jgi:hypothetical protein
MVDEVDRREFIKAAGGVAVGVAGVLPTVSPAGADVSGNAGGGRGAETIFRGGTIVTMVEGGPQIQAVAVSGGRILAAGDEATVMALANDNTKIIDLKGLRRRVP